jgi:diacylglycerol kinase family enzyme
MGRRKIPIAIIPFGTVNVLALDLGIPINPLEAVNVLLKGRYRRIDLGFLNNEPFLLMVSAGIDAMAVHNLDSKMKRCVGQLAYAFSALWTALREHPQRVQIYIEDQDLRDKGYLAVISNSRFYAGPFRIAEGRIDDGWLDVLLFKKSSLLDTLGLFLAVLTQQHRGMRDVAVYRGKVIHLLSKRILRMQVDGDKAPPAPARIWVKKRALSVLVPR